MTFMMSSFIINACINSGFKIMLLFAILAAISAILCFMLPQTYGKRPPEVIEELMNPVNVVADEQKEKQRGNYVKLAN